MPFAIGSAPSWPAETWMFCSCTRAYDVAGGHSARRDLVRVEPDAHRIVAAAENLHLADAGQASQFILDLDIGVVAQVERIIFPVRREQLDHHEKGRRLLLRRHAQADEPPTAGATAPG